MPAEPLIRLNDLTRRDHHRGRILLDSVNLSISEGDRIGLVGPSGSGKSCLLRAIARLDRCDSGSIEFLGEVVSRDAIPAFRRRVVYLSQRPSLFAGSVRVNLQAPFAMASARNDYDETVAIELLEACGKPTSLLDQASDSLSGGEQQIVALIRALMLQPIVLLLDEPSASLDADATSHLEKLVLRWQHSTPKGSSTRAFVLTSHNADQVKRMTTRVLRMDHGRLQPERES